MQIDPVEQRATDFGHISLDLRYRAMTFSPRIVSITAWARIEGGNEHKVGRERGRIQRPADRDVAILERLPQHFERCPIELRQFVEKQNAVVREADLAWRGRRAAPYEAGVGNRV